MYVGDQIIPVLGKLTTKCIVDGNEYMIKFYVTDSNTEPILGLSTCIELELIQRNTDRRIASMSMLPTNIFQKYRYIYRYRKNSR